MLAQVEQKNKCACSPREWWWENATTVIMSSELLSYFLQEEKSYEMIYIHFTERICLISKLWQLSKKALWFILSQTRKLYLADISGFYPAWLLLVLQYVLLVSRSDSSCVKDETSSTATLTLNNGTDEWGHSNFSWRIHLNGLTKQLNYYSVVTTSPFRKYFCLRHLLQLHISFTVQSFTNV